MRDRIFRKSTRIMRKAVLVVCIVLSAGTGLPLWAITPAYATGQQPIVIPNNPLTAVQGTVNTVTNAINNPLNTIQGTINTAVSNPLQALSAATITPQQFMQDPLSLLENSGAIGANVTSLIRNGVNPSSVAGVLGSVSAVGLPNISQWTDTLNNIGELGTNPAAAITLVNGMIRAELPGNIGQMLSGIEGLGNLNLNQFQTLLGTDNPITKALNGLSVGALGGAVDKVFQTALAGGNLTEIATQAGVQAISDALTQSIPQLSTILGPGGVQAAVSNLVANGVAGLMGGAMGAAVAAALGGIGGGAINANIGGCTQLCTTQCKVCKTEIPKHHKDIRSHVKQEFDKHRTWILTEFWIKHVLPALMLMAEQLSVAGIQQVEMIGALLDAKHQMETQRLFQQLTAEAHKDYQPSEGMCTFGTSVRSLAASDRSVNLTEVALAQRMFQRQSASGNVTSVEAYSSDLRSRAKNYIDKYCDQADNANQMDKLCKTATPKPQRRNIDIDYTRNIESRLTLDADFTQKASTEDSEDLFALSANLYAHDIAPRIKSEQLVSKDKKIFLSTAERYMDLRAVYAKRSVAQNSFAAIAAQRTKSVNADSAPYLRALIKELGVSDVAEIDKLIGKNPSYFAQMEILTKKLYQNPTFYTELYDKPANIERKGAALQAIGLMQDRDLYNSLLRSEVMLSVLLETMLQKEQQKVVTAIEKINPAKGQE